MKRQKSGAAVYESIHILTYFTDFTLTESVCVKHYTLFIKRIGTNFGILV